MNPIFPGLEDLQRLANGTQWYCTKMEELRPFICSQLQDTAASIQFCKGAVNYDVAVPEPQSEDEKSVHALVQKQDRAANTAFFAHLSGLGMDPWDYPKPLEADDCVSSIWRMVCYTYFPRAGAECARGKLMDYMRPCQSSCQNYIKACGVECCDESVQCVFKHEQRP